jgi:hypothetical protein
LYPPFFRIDKEGDDLFAELKGFWLKEVAITWLEVFDLSCECKYLLFFMCGLSPGTVVGPVNPEVFCNPHDLLHIPVWVIAVHDLVVLVLYLFDKDLVWSSLISLHQPGLKDRLRNGVWVECARTVTVLPNITALKSRDVCPYQLLFGSNPKLPESRKVFGEVGVVKTKNNIQGKLKNRGTGCMFVGHSVDHAHNIY